MKKLLLTFILIYLPLSNIAQNYSFYKKSDTLNFNRRNTVIISESVLAVGFLFALNQLWYKDYPRSDFHFKNDNNQWKQMDKVGHFVASYYIGKTGMKALDWAGVSQKKSTNLWCNFGFCFFN